MILVRNPSIICRPVNFGIARTFKRYILCKGHFGQVLRRKTVQVCLYIDIMKMNPLHYVLLAWIDAAPSGGYDLTLWLANLGQHYWAAEYSGIYPALR
jgi:hypothetical protein